MADKIKLENIVPAGFDTETGDEFVNITEEYVCENCRRIVELDDKYCHKCGEKLAQSLLVEHYQGAKKLTDKEFKKWAGE